MKNGGGKSTRQRGQLIRPTDLGTKRDFNTVGAEGARAGPKKEAGPEDTGEVSLRFMTKVFMDGG